jgi:FecR protein
MKRLLFSIGLLVLAVTVVMPSTTLADASHVRIVRLSVTQGDVRYARSFHDDPMIEGNATWEQAALNLPLREGYVLATGSGRAEVEFENGAMAFLSGNTVVEFYDLSLHDGGRITRLVLRQGSASFYVSPTSGDYFSVTGGDFTVETTSRATFRLDNFDDGSTVKVERGNVSVVRNEQTTPLEKGQSLSVHAGSPNDMVIGRASANDDFDRWASGQVESEIAATNSSNQYVSSPGYTAGFGDLYTYGSWFSVGGYGNCWRPFGMGMGWSPFSFGNWYYDPFFGWTFLGSAPWGWLPYHYGGWIFSPMYGWVWNPSGFGYGRPVYWRPVTAVFVHSGSTMGIVPLHPLDKSGKTPVNIGQGVFPIQGHEIAKSVMPTGTETWSVVRHAPRETLTGTPVVSTAPPRVSRTMYAGNATGRGASAVGSSIAYDPQEHRFVNANSVPSSATVVNEVKTSTIVPGREAPTNATAARPANAPTAPRATPAPRPAMAPAPAHTSGSSGGSSRASSGSSGASWGGSRSSGGSTSSSGSSGSSHPSGGGGGAHPH